MENLDQGVSSRLKSLRKRSNIPVRVVADQMEMPLSTYSSYERTFKRPFLPMEMSEKLHKVLVGHGDPPITARDVDLLFLPVNDVPEIDGLSWGARRARDVMGDDRLISDFSAPARSGSATPASRDEFVRIRTTRHLDHDLVFGLNDDEGGYIRLPSGINKREPCFAFYAANTAMSPRWQLGEIVFVAPGRYPSHNGPALLVLGQGETGDLRVVFGRLIYMSAKEYILETHVQKEKSIELVRTSFPYTESSRLFRVYEWHELI